MSREVDSRVVEMQFDNANFEKNTKQTISTIDRLMEKLRFKGVEKGFEALDKASGEVDFGQMSRSLDTLESKFSTLNVVATTALVNITNKVIDTGEKLVKSLSVDQVISGWNKYTEKTANVQTIMNATGDSIDTVNGYLNKLMWYSDETSFSFSEMTSALSQMTASGGNIKKMIPMIMGIANATADAGKSGFAFQSTIRNITQSYSAGYLQLQDWKSLNLMGTATKALKQELIDTAVELGTIKKGDVTIASFESSLSKKWANTKVMEKTFEKYASMMEAAYEMTQKDKSLTTSEALEKLTGQYGELAERSALAAQQAKSFGEAIDSTKDAVSSKWMKTFELIFGNKEEATGTWTELANRLYDIFVPPIEAMNDRFAEGLDSGWQQLHDKMGDQADTYSAVLQKVALANGIVTEESIEKAGSFGAALKESGASAELLQNGLDSTILTLKDYLAMSDKELNARNVDRDLVQKEYDALCKLSEEFRTGKASMDDFANAINRTSGREHLMQSLWNIMDAIGKVVTPIKEAFHEIFPAADGDRIYSFAERLDLLTKKLIISDETAEKIKTTFKGVFSVLRVGKDILSGIISGVVRVVSTAKPLAEVLLSTASSAGKFAYKITESLHPLETLGSWVTKFVDFVAPALYSFGSIADKVFLQFAEGAKNAFNEFDPDKLNQFILGGMGASMLVSVKGFLESIKSISSSAKGIVSGIKETIESLGEAVDTWRQAKKAETLMTIAKAVVMIAGSLTVLSMVKPERLGPAMLALATSMGGLLAVMQAMTMISKNVSGLKFSALSLGMISVSAAVLILSGALKAISTIGTEKLLASVLALGGVMTELTAVAKVLSADSRRFMKGSVGLIAFASGVRILASSMLVIGSMKWTQIGKGLTGIGGLCTELAIVAAALNKMKFGVGKGTAFLLLATSMNVLVKAFRNFASMEWDEIGKGLAAIGGALTEFTLALNLTKGALGSAASLTLMAAAINLLAPAFQGLGALSLGTIGTGLLAIAGAFGVLGGAAVLLSPLTPVIVALSVSLSAVALSLGALLALNSASMFIGNLASSLSLLNGLNFQVFLKGIKSVAWLLVEFITGVFEGLAKVSSSLVGSIATIIASICDAIVLAAPSIGNALYVVGTTVIDTVVKLLTYVWDKIEPALNDLWEKFKGWIAAHNPFDISNWNVSDKVSANSVVVQKTFWQPFQDILDELQHGDSVMAGIYQAFTGVGKNSSEGLAEGQLESKKAVIDASSEVADAAVDAAKAALDEHSPSKVMAEIGQYMTLGLAEGISDQSVLARAKNAMQSVAAAIRSVFTTFWGIHSPSEYMAELAEYIPEGAAIGIENGTSDVTDAVDKQSTEVQRHYSDYRNNLIQQNQEAVSGVRNVLETGFTDIGAMAKTKGAEALQNFANGMTDGMSQMFGKSKWLNSDIANNLLENAKSLLGGDMSWFEPMFAKTNDDAANVASTATGKTGSKSKASKTGKTLADTLSEAYSKQLKANKAKKDAASGEYALWEVTDGDTASVEELIRQKTESLTKEIELQTERVAIAKEQYDTLLSKVGAEDDKTKDAYSTMLSEQKTLAQLQRDKQDSIFKVIQERYESDSKTAQDEYNLWSALYEDSAAVTEKSNKKIEYINKKILVQAEILTAAEQDYTETKKKFGEASAATQAAYRQYLEEKTSQQELINELNKAQIEAFDNEVSYLEKQEKLITNRQSMLAKIYGDGSLADRENAYKEAVEKYGEGSLEARRASATGTMTAIIGVGTALDSMSYSLRKVTNKQLKYDEAVKKFGKNSETALDALADLQDEQYSFVGFAEDLADAFDMDDTGKQITMQLGYSISKNWKPIQDGFNSVWDQVKVSFPDAANRLASAFGVATKDGFGTVATDLFATIKAIAIGDWGSAISGGLATALDFVGSEFGQSVLSTVGNALYQLPEAFGKLAEGGGTVKILGQLTQVKGTTEGLGSIVRNLTGLVGNASSGTGLVGKAVQGLGKIGGMISGSGGLLGGLGELGGTLVSVLGSIGPEGWLIGAAIAGGGLLIANWDKVSDFFSDFFDWLGNAFSGLWDWISNGFKGLVDVGGDLISGLWNGITGAAGAIWNGVTSFCGGILDGICDFFGIHSPSTVMAEVGQYLSLGLAQGITGSADDVTSSMEELSRNTLSTMEAVVDRVSSVAAEDFDYEPTIRPVMDMTDVQNGADWLNGNLFRESSMALNADRTAGLAANVVRRAEAERNAASMEPTDNTDTMTTKDIVESVEALGEHVDNIAYAVSQMKMSIDGRKFVGGIISEVDEQLGRIAKRR